jgi:hypothetical protein
LLTRLRALGVQLENLELQSESRLQGKDEEIAELRKQLRRAIGERDSANAKCEEHAALAVRLAQENNALRDQCVQLQEAARGGKAAAPAAAAANERDGASRGRARSPTKSGTERRSSSVNSRGCVAPRAIACRAADARVQRVAARQLEPAVDECVVGARRVGAALAQRASAVDGRRGRTQHAGGRCCGCSCGCERGIGLVQAVPAARQRLRRRSGAPCARAERRVWTYVRASLRVRHPLTWARACCVAGSASPPSSIPRKSSLEDVAGAAAGGNRSAVSPPRMPGKARAGSQEAPEQFGSGPATPVDTSPGMRRPVSDSIGGAGAPHSAAAHRHDVRVQRAHGPSSGPAATSVSSPTTPTDSAAAAAGRSHAAGVMSGIEFDDAANMSRSRLVRACVCVLACVSLRSDAVADGHAVLAAAAGRDDAVRPCRPRDVEHSGTRVPVRAARLTRVTRSRATPPTRR